MEYIQSLHFNYPVVVDAIGLTIDFIGVVTLGFGVIISISIYLASFLFERKKGGMSSYNVLRFNLARSILLGLEFLVAGDIIRSIATPPSFNAVLILAMIVLIRSFLSWEFERRTEGYFSQEKSESVKDK